MSKKVYVVVHQKEDLTHVFSTIEEAHDAILEYYTIEPTLEEIQDSIKLQGCWKEYFDDYGTLEVTECVIDDF